MHELTHVNIHVHACELKESQIDNTNPPIKLEQSKMICISILCLYSIEHVHAINVMHLHIDMIKIKFHIVFITF